MNNLDQLIDTLLINKHLIAKEYGITILEQPGATDGIVISYPVFDKIMADCLIPDELAYFFCRTFNKETTEAEREAYFV